MAAMALRFSLLLLVSLYISVNARPGLPFHPCNTLIVSTYSFSLLPRNPNLPPEFITVIAEVRPEFELKTSRILPRPQFDRPQRPEFPLGFSSLRDRTNDILSVVASLLFGAACGALTAGTMYLIWSLFNRRSGSYGSVRGFSSDDDDGDDDDDIFNPKKEYVPIPAAPVSTPISASPAPAKESA